ncbi:hypothetical protein L2E82_38098 [Cichorium intybus]|uniref:Uncharacterized protein n=1 Tax=Cichorium intybus TaxID=13427 RepID=A0ACB9AGI1_CICIN|nr:hypothetical protein L2E82_38098 [Cichorium intybus]
MEPSCDRNHVSVAETKLQPVLGKKSQKLSKHLGLHEQLVTEIMEPNLKTGCRTDDCTVKYVDDRRGLRSIVSNLIPDVRHSTKRKQGNTGLKLGLTSYFRLRSGLVSVGLTSYIIWA